MNTADHNDTAVLDPPGTEAMESNDGYEMDDLPRVADSGPVLEPTTTDHDTRQLLRDQLEQTQRLLATEQARRVKAERRTQTVEQPTAPVDFQAALETLLRNERETREQIAHLTDRMAKIHESPHVPVTPATSQTGRSEDPFDNFTVRTEHQSKSPRPRWLRALQISIALFILTAVLFSFLLPYVLPVSGNSVVNARLTWIQAPIAGHVQPNSAQLGDLVHVDDHLARIRNERVDTSVLLHLETEHARLESIGKSLEARLAALEEKRVLLADAISTIKADLLTDLEHQITKEKLKLDELRANELHLAQRIARFDEANDRAAGDYPVISREEHAAAQRQHAVARKDIEIQEAQLEQLRNRRVTIQAERFVNMDKPIEIQQLKETNEQIAGLHIQLQENARRVHHLSSQIATEEKRITRLRAADLFAPITGPLWRLKVGHDTFVNTGDQVMAIADESTVAVECYLHQRYLDAISIGDRAVIHLMGNDRELVGTVRQIHIRDEKEVDHQYAYRLSVEDENHFKITIALDEHTKSAALIGQRAQVLVTGESPGWFKRLMLATYSAIAF